MMESGRRLSTRFASLMAVGLAVFSGAAACQTDDRSAAALSDSVLELRGAMAAVAARLTSSIETGFKV